MSDILNINWKDLLKGLIVAVFTVVLTTVYQMLQQRTVIDLKEIGIVGLIALVGYLLKQLGTDSEGKFIGKL